MRFFLSRRSLLKWLALMTTFLFVSTVWGGGQSDIANNISANSSQTISAQYITTQCATGCQTSSKRIWWMFRSPSQVELRDMNINTGLPAKASELWRLNPDGKLNYVYLMHQDQRAIEYLFDDLRILGIEADQKKWEILTQLVTRDELASMTKSAAKAEPVQGFEAVTYAGQINNAKVELTWLPQLNLPAKIVYFYPKSTVTITLQSIVNPDSNPAQVNQIMTTDQQLESYQQVYYTDIGDMEQNAEAQDWIAKAEGAPGLHHHH